MTMPAYLAVAIVETVVGREVRQLLYITCLLQVTKVFWRNVLPIKSSLEV